MRLSIFAATLAARLALILPVVAAASVNEASAQSPAAARVGTILAEKAPINPAKEFVGRVEAIERVSVRARVTGYLDAVLFKEGDLVKQGAPLYRIEQQLFQAAVQQNEGALVKAQGQEANAKVQLDRAETLLKTQAGSAAVRDQRVAEDQTAKGDVLIAQANLQTAKINLGYTEITAPITGLVGRTSVTKGNVVGPDSGALTTIVSQDPMYVVVPVSQREFLQFGEEKRRAGQGAVTFKIRFSDGSAYEYPGQFNFVDVSVDKATDAVTVRATVPNPKGRLIDGQLVTVSIEGKQPEEKILIPQAALIADQQGVYVFVVEDGKAVVRRVKVGGEAGPNVIVASGLSAGDQVIVEGMEALRPGAPVMAAPAQTAASRS